MHTTFFHFFFCSVHFLERWHFSPESFFRFSKEYVCAYNCAPVFRWNSDIARIVNLQRFCNYFYTYFRKETLMRKSPNCVCECQQHILLEMHRICCTCHFTEKIYLIYEQKRRIVKNLSFFLNKSYNRLKGCKNIYLI